MSWVFASAITGGASIASGLIGSRASKKAAAETAGAIREATALQERMFQQGRQDLAPYRDIGYQSLKDITAQKPFLTGKFEDYRDQYLDPSMAFRLGIGEQTTQRAANVGGGALSGNTLRALQDYSQGLASTEYSNAFNRFQTERGNIYNTLANIAGMGQNAVNTGVQAGQATAQNMGQLIVGGGQAQAAGTIGAANAIASGLGGVGNAAQLYGLGKSGFFNKPTTNVAT
jgi:hypothetical protein